MRKKGLHPLLQPPCWIWGPKSRLCIRWSLNCRKSATRCRRHHPTNANIGSTRAQRVDGRPSVRHARGHVARNSEKVVGVDVPSRPGCRETRRDDRRHGSMMSSRHSSESVEGRGGQFLLRDARYGLRGVRAGEATSPPVPPPFRKFVRG